MALRIPVSDGVQRIDYDAATRFAVVYYTAGGAERFYDVSWSDVSAVVTAASPIAAVSTNLKAKYKSSGPGARD